MLSCGVEVISAHVDWLLEYVYFRYLYDLLYIVKFHRAIRDIDLLAFIRVLIFPFLIIISNGSDNVFALDNEMTTLITS